MTFGEIKDKVRSALGETDPALAFISDSELNAFINDGILDMAGRARIYHTVQTLSLQTGVAAYALPSNYIDSVAVIKAANDPWAPGAALDRILPEQVGRVYRTTGRPDYFYIVESTLYLHDAPDSSHVGLQYSHIYTGHPALYTSDDAALQLNPKWHPALVDYVLSQAALKYKLVDISAGVWTRYIQRMGATPNG